MATHDLQKEIERHFAAGPAAIGSVPAMDAFLALRSALESGKVRAAQPDANAPTRWRVNPWVKQGILLGFRLGALEELPAGGLSFVDKHTYPARHFASAEMASAWSQAAHRCAPAPLSPAASSACRPCTSTRARRSMKAPWSIPTRSSVPARRSASMCI